MTVPTLGELLDDLDRTTDRDRQRRLAVLGRDHAGDPALGGLVDALLASDTTAARWGLRIAIAARDRGRVVAAARDPRVPVRSMAVARLVAVGATDDEIRSLVLDAPTADRRHLLAVVARGRRHDLADGLVDELRARVGDADAARLLATCHEATVRRLLPDLEHALASWTALARRHPDAVLAHVESVVGSLPTGERDRAWVRLGRAVAAASRERPSAALAVIERVGPRDGLPPAMDPELSRLLRREPVRTLRLLLAPDGRVVAQGQLPRGALSAAGALGHDERVALARVVRDRVWQLVELLSRLPPSDRAAVMADAHHDVDLGTKVWAPTVLEVLPLADRVGEVRRILGLTAVASTPASVRTFASLLPWPEPLEHLDPVLAARTGEERAEGYRLLVGGAATSRDPEVLRAVLDRLRRVRNESDVVRYAALDRLAQWPAHVIGPEHLPALDELVTAAAEARDTSRATVHVLTQLELRLATAHAAGAGPVFRHAVTALEQLAGADGWLALGRLDQSLPRGAEAHLVGALLQRLRADAEHDRYRLALALCDSLGRRAWESTELQAVLERGATTLRTTGAATALIDRWLADPRSRAERVGRLVAVDPSVVVVRSVEAAIASRRQDLVDLLVSTTPLEGRFLSGGIRTVPLLDRAPATWLPRQQDAYLEALWALVADESTSSSVLAAAVRCLARIPGERARAALVALTSDPRVVVAEAALGGLPWTDRPDTTLDLLFAHAGGDRARVAVYAAARAARLTPPDALAAAVTRLLDDPSSKVTARKEAVRILGANRAGATTELLAACCDRAWHRDVTMALGRAVRDLDDPRAAALLARLAAGNADEARSLLDTAPESLAPHLRPAFARHIVVAAAHPDPDTRAAALWALVPWARWAPTDAAEVAASQVLAPDRSPAADRAITALVRMAGDGWGVDRLDEVLRSLAARDARAEADAEPDRDVPSRQRLAALVLAIDRAGGAAAETLRPWVSRWADVLAARPETLRLAAALEVAVADWSDPSAALVRVAARVADEPVVASIVAPTVAVALGDGRRRWSPPQVAAAADALIADGRPGALRLAVVAVSMAGETGGWDPDARAALRRLRDLAASDAGLGAALLDVVTSRE